MDLPAPVFVLLRIAIGLAIAFPAYEVVWPPNDELWSDGYTWDCEHEYTLEPAP